MKPEALFPSVLSASGVDPKNGALRLTPDGSRSLEALLATGMNDSLFEELCTVLGFLASKPTSARLAVDLALAARRACPGLGQESKKKKLERFLAQPKSVPLPAQTQPRRGVPLSSIAPPRIIR